MGNVKEINILEQQISEIIKVWYYFDSSSARIIVQDEGEGFNKIEQWNEFHRTREKYLDENNFEKLANFVSYRTEESDENDGGNALFAALEY